MFKFLRRFLLLGLLIFAAIWVVSRLINREEDFDDYDDIDLGMEFTETPVEIEVSAPTRSEMDTIALETVPAPLSPQPKAQQATASESKAGSESENGQSGALIDINGIGPTYAARLQDAGISTVADLAQANPETLAEKIEVIGGHTAIEEWVKQAQDMISGGAPGND